MILSNVTSCKQNRYIFFAGEKNFVGSKVQCRLQKCGASATSTFEFNLFEKLSLRNIRVRSLDSKAAQPKVHTSSEAFRPIFYCWCLFLAGRANGYTLIRHDVVSVCRLSVTLSIVAKEYVLLKNCLKKQTSLLDCYSLVSIPTFYIQARREPQRGPGKHSRGAPNIFKGPFGKKIFDFLKWYILA